jgi:hypothetical protein
MCFACKFSATLRLCVVPALVAAWGSIALFAQAPAPPPPSDVLIFTDGEKLIGELKSAKGTSVTFKSNIAGEVTVDWSKVAELQTTHPFAVIPKSVKVTKTIDVNQVPEGNLSMKDQKIVVATTPAPRTVPVADSAFVVDQPSFQKAVDHNQGFFQDWNGAVTAGVSLVEATQKSDTFTGGIALVRAEPTESWISPRNRTLFDFSASYGKVTQPGTPTSAAEDIKTDIIHVDGERDQYFSPSVFGFGQFAFDHNFSQGLDLQQTYGGGLGWTVFKSGTQEFDLKGSVAYIHQSFADAGVNQSLIGSTFAEIYTRKLAHGILFNEQIAATPAWNNTNAYSATGTAGLIFPVYKRFSLAITTLDTFLNDPPPGFKKNSFQFTTGLTYTLR